MSTFVIRLKPRRQTFALDMSKEEREIVARHAAHWQPWIDSGQMVIFGLVLDASGSWGLAVVETDDEEKLRAFAADDPVVTTGTGLMDVGNMLGGFVRQRPDSQQTKKCGWPGLARCRRTRRRGRMGHSPWSGASKSLTVPVGLREPGPRQLRLAGRREGLEPGPDPPATARFSCVARGRRSGTASTASSAFFRSSCNLHA